MGADLIIEINVAEDLALVEEQLEFMKRYNNYINGDKTSLPMMASTCPGNLISE